MFYLHTSWNRRTILSWKQAQSILLGTCVTCVSVSSSERRFHSVYKAAVVFQCVWTPNFVPYLMAGGWGARREQKTMVKETWVLCGSRQLKWSFNCSGKRKNDHNTPFFLFFFRMNECRNNSNDKSCPTFQFSDSSHIIMSQQDWGLWALFFEDPSGDPLVWLCR